MTTYLLVLLVSCQLSLTPQYSPCYFGCIRFLCPLVCLLSALSASLIASFCVKLYFLDFHLSVSCILTLDLTITMCFWEFCCSLVCDFPTFEAKELKLQIIDKVTWWSGVFLLSPALRRSQPELKWPAKRRQAMLYLQRSSLKVHIVINGQTGAISETQNDKLPSQCPAFCRLTLIWHVFEGCVV